MRPFRWPWWQPVVKFTFKVKRPQLLKRYQAQVDAMYVSLGEDPSKFKV